MVSLNWFLIRRIGQMMAIDFALISMASAAKKEQPQTKASIRDQDPNDKDRGDPLIGVFHSSTNGDSMLYCNEMDLLYINNAIYLTIGGEQGKVIHIQSIKYGSGAFQNKFAGNYLENVNAESIIYKYTGKTKLNALGKGPAEVGYLLRQGSVIDKKIDCNKYCIKYKGRDYIVDTLRSNEGIHFRSVAVPAKLEQSHYYYYLGYETD